MTSMGHHTLYSLATKPTHQHTSSLLPPHSHLPDRQALTRISPTDIVFRRMRSPTVEQNILPHALARTSSEIKMATGEGEGPRRTIPNTERGQRQIDRF